MNKEKNVGKRLHILEGMVIRVITLAHSGITHISL